jgi:predicted RNase H-like HicB family nuclease
MRALEVDGLIWQQRNVFVSYCPELDVSSCGDTIEEARANLKTVLRLFLEEAEKMGNVDSILKEFSFKKTSWGWQGPHYGKVTAK